MPMVIEFSQKFGPFNFLQYANGRETWRTYSQFIAFIGRITSSIINTNTVFTTTVQYMLSRSSGNKLSWNESITGSSNPNKKQAWVIIIQIKPWKESLWMRFSFIYIWIWSQFNVHDASTFGASFQVYSLMALFKPF